MKWDLNIFSLPELPGAGPRAVITDVKIIPCSIKIFFYAARVYTTMIATLGRMIEFSLTLFASSAGPARALLRSDAVPVGPCLQGGSSGPLSDDRDGRRRLWT